MPERKRFFSTAGALVVITVYGTSIQSKILLRSSSAHSNSEWVLKCYLLYHRQKFQKNLYSYLWQTIDWLSLPLITIKRVDDFFFSGNLSWIISDIQEPNSRARFVWWQCCNEWILKNLLSDSWLWYWHLNLYTEVHLWLFDFRTFWIFEYWLYWCLTAQ